MLVQYQAHGFQSPLSDAYLRQGQPSTALMVLIGHIIRTQPREQIQDLLRLLRQSLSPKQDSGFSDTSVVDENDRRSADADSLKEWMPLKAPRQEADISKYTSILKEKGDVAGFMPQYNCKQITLMPSLWKAVVSFQDYVFEGSGRSKQQAKHVASREACKALGL